MDPLKSSDQENIGFTQCFHQMITAVIMTSSGLYIKTDIWMINFSKETNIVHNKKSLQKAFLPAGLSSIFNLGTFDAL